MSNHTIQHLADDSLADILSFCHPLEWVLHLSRVSSLWRIVCFELIQKQFDEVHTNNRSNPALRNFEQIFSTEKGHLFLLRSIKKLIYQWSSFIIERYGPLSNLKNVNYQWLEEDMKLLTSYLKNKRFLKNITKSGNIEEHEFLLVMEHENLFYPFNYTNGVKSPPPISILGLKTPLPQLSYTKKDKHDLYYGYERDGRVIDDTIIERSSMIISLTDTSSFQHLKYLGKVLNDIKDSKAYSKRKYYWETATSINHLYRPVIMLGLNFKSSSATTTTTTIDKEQQIPFEQLDRMAFNFNGSLYIELDRQKKSSTTTTTNYQKDLDKILLFGLFLIYIQKVYQIQFR